MGCWIETCFISHLPILYGEKCGLFFIKRNQNSGSGNRTSAGFCYPTDMWSSCSFILKGTYNDYGSVESIDTNSLSATLALKYFQDKLSSPTLSLEDIQTKISQEELEGFGMVFVRHDVYQAILKRGFENSWRPNKLVTVDRVAAQGKLLMSTLMSQELTVQKLFSFPEYTMEDGEFGHFVSSYGNAIPYKKLLMECVFNKTDPEPLVNLIAEHLMLEGCLSSLRRAWMPQSGKGSQDEAWEEHVWLADLVKKIAKKEMRRE